MARRTRYKIRSGEERVAEYEIALQGKDRPTWSEEKIKSMTANARDVYTELAQLDEKVKNICPQLGIPTHKRMDVLRIVRHAWKLANRGAPSTQYDEEVSFMCRKYGIDIGLMNRILKAVGLPEVGAGAGAGGGLLTVP